MGTSSAYEGTLGWKGIRNDTDAWVESRIEPQSGDAGGRDSDQASQTRPAGAVADGTRGTGRGEERRLLPNTPHSVGLLERLMRSLLALLLPGVSGGETAKTTGHGSVRHDAGRGAGHDGGGGGGHTFGDDTVGEVGRSARGSSGRKVRGLRQAEISGSVVIAALYGVRSGDEGSVGDAGFSLADLVAMSPFRRAQRIIDAAAGASVLLEDAELREVHAHVVCWAMEQHPFPSPADMVKRWVCEYLYRIWLMEAGSALRDGSLDGELTYTLEQDFRAFLEARVSDTELSVDGIRASHIEAAIRTLLQTIRDMDW